MQANIQNPAAKFKTAAVQELAEKVSAKLRARIGENFISETIDYDFPVFNLKRESIVEALEYLYNDSELEFRFLTTMATIHYPDRKGEEFTMMYQLHNMPKNWQIRLKITMPLEDPSVNTATTLFRTANWMERQEFDFYGIIFKGHPNLKRILNMDEMNYYPMRKEFPLEDGSRTDKDDAMFGR